MKTAPHWIAIVALLAIVGGMVVPLTACPFCSAVQQTLSEEIKNADAALIIKLAKARFADSGVQLSYLYGHSNIGYGTAHNLVLHGSGEGALLSNERLALAHAVLATLSDEQREVFVLSRVKQMSAPEIGSVIGIPINTVYSRLRAARLAFEAEIARRRSPSRNTP